MRTAREKRLAMRDILNGAECAIAPGVADAMSAKLVKQIGFRAMYLSGSLQHRMRGHADVNILTMSEMVANCQGVADAIDLPCLADGETGFGYGVNVRRTVKEFERAGVSALHIEDSTVPKRPAHLGFDSPTVSQAEFVDKIKAALDARQDETLVIVARSELIGDDNAKADRLQAAVEEGADAFWVVAQKQEIMQALCKRMGKPAVGVMPTSWNARDFGAGGCRLGVLPGAMGVAALMAQQAMLKELLATGTPGKWLESGNNFAEMNVFFSKMGVEELA